MHRIPFLQYGEVTYSYCVTHIAVLEKVKELKSGKIAQIVGLSLEDYLAQVIYAKNCPTTFYCIFQLVWVPMTTTQNIRVASLAPGKHFEYSFLQRGDPYEKSVF